MFRHLIFDVDQTIVDTQHIEQARKNRDWNEAYRLIPKAFVYEGFEIVFEIVRKHEIQIALVSSSPRPYIERIVRQFSIPCRHIVAYHDARPKPDPDSFHKALSLMNASARDAISFGDRCIDIHASNAAGVESVACFWGTREEHQLLNSGYRHAIRKPIEILTLIR